MPKTKTAKPQKHRYVVEVLVETEVKVTKKAVREALERVQPWFDELNAHRRIRVRKVDMD